MFNKHKTKGRQLVFSTHQEAMIYAKNNPGVVVTINSNTNEYIIKNVNKEKQASKNVTLLKDARALLLDTANELRYLCSCILQTDEKTTQTLTQKAGEIIASKLGGAGVASGTLGLISTFGTAGTGTAIGTLSGAAATNATLAALGSIVGGGMFAGGILVIGITAGSGFAFYKMFKSKPREYDMLPKNDKLIIDKCFVLINTIEEETAGIVIPSNDKVKEFGKNDIIPIYKLLKEHKNNIKANLDVRNATALMMKVVPNLDKLIVRYSTI